MGSQDNDLIFREVDEDLHNDKMKALAKRYGPIVVGVVLVVVAAVAGREAWRYYDTTQRMAAADKYTAARAQVLGDTPDIAAAIEGFARLAEESNSGYRVLARLQQAALLTEQGNRDQALSIYESLSADPSVEETFRDLALILSVMNIGEAADPASVVTRLEPVAAKAGPWRYFARELVAVYAMLADNPALATEELQILADDGSAPAGVRRRAAELLRVIGR